jgi:hypothetical protein
MLPVLIKYERVERIRDGGSLAAIFLSDGGHRYILFVEKIFEGPTRFGQPVLIDCDPAKRPPDTERIRHSELSGPQISVSWAQARDLLKELPNGLIGPTDKLQTQWLQDMIDVVAHDGYPL